MMFPIKTKLYFHGNSEERYEQGEELELSGNQMDNFCQSGNEIVIDIVIDKEGKVFATHVNNIALVTLVKL